MLVGLLGTSKITYDSLPTGAYVSQRRKIRGRVFLSDMSAQEYQPSPKKIGSTIAIRWINTQILVNRLVMAKKKDS